MTSLTPADLEDSDKLISIVVSLIGGGLAFWLLSQALLRNHQLHLLRWLLQAKRDSIYFLEVTLQGSLGKGKTLLTWSIKDGGEYFGQYRSFADEARLTERVKLRKLRNSTSTSRFNQGMNDIVLGPDHHDLLGTPRTIQMEEEGPSSTNRSQPTKVEDVTIVDTCMSRKGITCRMRSPSAMLLTKTPAKYRPGVTMPIGMMEFDMESMGDHQSEAGREDIKLDDALKSPKSTSSEHQLADSGNVGLSSMVALLLSSEAEQQWHEAILVDGMAAEEAMEEEEESKPPSRRTRKSRRYQPTSAQGSQAILVDGMAAEEAVEEKEERRRRSSVKVLGNKLLSFDRMLGTAVMHAFLSNTNLYSHQELREQAMLQEMVPWTMPIGRNFSWYVQVLMVALVQVKTSGWLRRSHLLQLVFLQAVDGHVPMTQSLANLMRVGEPEQPLLIKPAGIFPLAAFQKSVPKELETILDSHAVRWSAEAVWATACAIALYDQELMADWIVNPAEKPRALQRTLGEHAQHWLDRIVQDDPALRDCIAETQDQATRFVQGCIEQHWKRVSEFQQATLARSAPVPWWQRWPRNVRKEIRGLFWIYVSSHPLLALWATPVSAPLSRAEAITLQVNNVLMMLSVVTWFEYSRAITCCEELKEHLGCEPASDSAAACIGFATCGALYDAAADMAPLPQELGTWAPSQCLAFPQNTLIGKMYATALVVAILLPVNATLQALFKVTTTTPVLSFWSSSPRSKKKSSALLGPLGSMLLHATMTMLYALLDNFERFTKAMALIIAGVAMLLLKPADKIVSVIFAVASTMRLIKRRLVKAIITGDRQRRQQEHADHLAQLIVAPFVNGHIETFTYGFILIFWGTLMWILLAFLTVLRGTMGREWEQELLVGWAMGLLMEHFGLVSLRLVGFKMLAVFFVGKVHAQLSNHLEIANWYESKVEEDVQLLRMEAHERRAQGK
eukprot:gene14670-17334_t